MQGTPGEIATPTQSPESHDPQMDNPDDALLTAADRARQAEEGFRDTPPEDPAIVPKAHKVYQRAEDVGELARDARSDAEAGDTLSDNLTEGGPNSA